MRLLPAALLLFACGGAPVRAPAGPSDPADPAPDAPEVERVDVAHERELRGVWLTTAWNIDFPRDPGAGPTAQERELIEILDILQELRFNAVFFQVRPEGDALYASEIEPWSRVLTGTQGQDPGWDPLQVLIDEGHARNLEIHAWLNPYRAQVSRAQAVASPHIAVTHPTAVVRYGDQVWMDPGQPIVQDRLIAVIEDLTDRYPIDGVHFDDYFYPYPISGTPFPDDGTYADYQRSGGTLGRADWRRENVNAMVQRVHETLRARDPSVRFGISPLGIYRPGQPEGITGLDAYEALYADPVRWADEGWVDYLAPQLYWPTTQTRQAFEPLIGWWSDLGDGRHHTFAGLYLSQLGQTSAWTLDELGAQVALSRGERARGSLGNLWFSYRPIAQDRLGVRAFLRDRIHLAPALSPAFGEPERPVRPPTVQAIDGGVAASPRDAGRALLLYREVEGAWQLDRILPSAPVELALLPGRYAVSAADRTSHESLGIVVEVAAAPAE